MALTLTNIRADPVTVRFMAGGDTHDINLGPGESSEEACDKGCLLTLADGTEQTFLPEDHVLINRDGFALAE
ncbi:hypothetical protein [Leisingera thetidis]|uniref:hypothetical protein n=1 Tax=Leisingera thetidis TaxID=2930199 RepID=UPI0021F7F7E1|nr:hypothetical protein [Leisingera thetidis]